MASWLVITILAYFFWALSGVGDKLFLKGKPTPASYVFYMSAFGLLALVLIPFADFGIPEAVLLGWIALAALARFLSTYLWYTALEHFEVSRVLPAIGALQPVLMFFIAWVAFGEHIIMPKNILAFVLLILGGILISVEKKIRVNIKYSTLILVTALLVSLDFTFAKIVYSNTSFLNGFIWISVGVLFFALFLLFSKKDRRQIFSKEVILDKKEQGLFLVTQVFGGLGGIFYNFAIMLAPAAFFAVIGSLRGAQYAFLFLIVIILSLFWPKLFKEKLSSKIIFQKVAAIIIIAVGLAILSI